MEEEEKKEDLDELWREAELSVPTVLDARAWHAQHDKTQAD